MAEHSPTPWQSVADRGGRTIGDANGIFVAAALEATDTALIVRAVNAYVAITSSPGPGFQSYEELVAENAKLRAMLDEVEEWLDDRADADCDQDGYIPNDEMRLLTTVRTVLHGSNAP